MLNKDMSTTLKRNFGFTCSRMLLTSPTITDIVLPATLLGDTIQPSPFKQIKRPGDTISTDPIQISFLVDEDLGNYLEIFDWLLSCENGSSSSNAYLDKVSDASMVLFNNNSIRMFEFTMEGCFPTFLSELSFSNGQESSEIQTAQLTLECVKLSYTR